MMEPCAICCGQTLMRLMDGDPVLEGQGSCLVGIQPWLSMKPINSASSAEHISLSWKATSSCLMTSL